MADVECGKFELLRQAPAPGMLTFRACLNAVPSALWRAVFDHFQGMECAVGAPAVARIRGDIIEFSVADSCAPVAAAAIRRCIEKTNREVATRDARHDSVVPGGSEPVEHEWDRVQDKYREGL